MQMSIDKDVKSAAADENFYLNLKKIIIQQMILVH
jgi:hypothetical protein